MEYWRKNKIAFGIFMGPATLWLVLFFLLPLVVVWVYSFGDRGPQGQTIITFSLENYSRALEWIHLGIIWKSIWVATLSTVLCLAIGFPLAKGIAFAPAKWKNPLLLIVILPFWTNLLIRTYSWIAVLRTKGYVNFTLEWFHEKLNAIFTFAGVPEIMGTFQPLALLYNQSAVIIGLVYVQLPFLVLPLYASMEKLDRSYLEASLDLGAGHWRTLFNVTVPLVMPGIASGVFLTFILSLGTFLTPALLGGTDSMMIGNLIAQQFGPSRDWAFGSALSFILMYVTFIILWIKAVKARDGDSVGL
ncbi:MAG: ABC transporter permease [Rhodospirillales bacterium]|nr:ABC transporter permease [Rhodospirillales bacterium]